MLLSVTKIRSGYATGDVVQEVSLDVDDGEVVSVLGRNGVGKTTVLKTLMGILRVRSGSIRFRDNDITNLPAHQRARLGIGYVPQGRGIFSHMSVLDNLRMGGFINGGKNTPNFEAMFGLFPFLKDRCSQRGATLSGGQQEMLAIARALINGPDLLLLDEPSDGVQPNIVDEIGDIIIDLNRRRNVAVLIVEQNIDLVQKVASRAHVLDKGRVVRTLERQELQDTERLAGFLAI